MINAAAAIESMVRTRDLLFPYSDATHVPAAGHPPSLGWLAPKVPATPSEVRVRFGGKGVSEGCPLAGSMRKSAVFPEGGWHLRCQPPRARGRATLALE